MPDQFHLETETLAAVVDQHGFARAARYLKISPALASRRIALLEQQLGVTLLTRSTRAFELTAEGKLVYQYAKKIIREKHTTLLAIQAMRDRPAGLIKISAPRHFGRRYVARAMAAFMEIYPEIEVELLLSNSQTDLINEQYDLAIRGTGYLDHDQLTENNLIAKKILTSKILLCANPNSSFLAAPINSASDMVGLPGIDFEPNPTQQDQTIRWTNSDTDTFVTLHKRMACNDIDTAIQMALAGHGIIRVAEINVKDELMAGNLVPILSQHHWGTYGLYAVYPQRQLPERTRRLVDFLVDQWGHLGA